MKKQQQGYALVVRPTSYLPLWRRLAQRVRSWRALSVQRHRLATLGEATLKDLGLSRADIEQEIHRPFWDGPAESDVLRDDRSHD
ncbi:DUF1127 domain-containing protein [Pseudomonas kuykendallii]|uniref:Uncharacterized conserved protein YjiS, DUF1127 family n=1 Tax=Pseudomonas kuykendallii TaxID=1007099 RepID=A0A1H3DZZ2_9PSED|nr:DUF1127 domain-containing protein [Pseudomonas kuykendallii]MCQ4270078.1 DUF1127 domain-containing protein [Pseudomonas kuykendallii]SDX71930.1 Uncharacterized conserved protein YjiS, DUF1127 family [Pseudomonas kuykendallii]